MRHTVLLIFLFGIIASLHSQYREDAWILSPKISFADYSDQSNWENYSISKVPPISVFLERGINNYFSAGGFIGYNGDKYTNDTIPENVMRYKTFTTGAVATIHYAHWLEALSGHSIFLGDFDLYISGAFQMALKNTNEQHFWDPDTETFKDNKSSEVKFRIRPILGIRYFLTERFCMLFEAGKGNPGMITTGVSWNLY